MCKLSPRLILKLQNPYSDYKVDCTKGEGELITQVTKNMLLSILIVWDIFLTNFAQIMKQSIVFFVQMSPNLNLLAHDTK